MFDPRSRYASLPTVAVPTPDGGTRVMTTPRIAAQPPVIARTEIRAGQRLDLLAGALTGDTTWWWTVADANPWADATRLERPGAVVDLPGR
ncbi:hypothetical protein ACI797_11490 [Geodermatophilus sp. SYSU D00691]